MNASTQPLRSPSMADRDLHRSLGLGALLGRIDGIDGTTVRIIVEGEDLRWEVNAVGGSFALDRLEPGRYRVEMRTERLVIARRIEITPGHNEIVLTVQPKVAHRIGLVDSALAPVIPLPV